MDAVLKRILECIGPKHGAGKKLADFLGVHPNVITNWKAGKLKSYTKYTAQIAEFYGVSEAYLLGISNEKSAPTETDESTNDIDFSALRNTDGSPVSEEKMQIILRILSMGQDDTSTFKKWIDFMDDLNQRKK